MTTTTDQTDVRRKRVDDLGGPIFTTSQMKSGMTVMAKSENGSNE